MTCATIGVADRNITNIVAHSVCCSMLQCVAVCCSVVQCVAVCCSVVQCGALCCSVLIARLQTRRNISKSIIHLNATNTNVNARPTRTCIYAWDVQRFTYIKLACIRLNFLHWCVSFVGPLLNFEECLANRALLE